MNELPPFTPSIVIPDELLFTISNDVVLSELKFQYFKNLIWFSAIDKSTSSFEFKNCTFDDVIVFLIFNWLG